MSFIFSENIFFSTIENDQGHLHFSVAVADKLTSLCFCALIANPCLNRPSGPFLIPDHALVLALFNYSLTVGKVRLFSFSFTSLWISEPNPLESTLLLTILETFFFLKRSLNYELMSRVFTVGF